MVILHENKIVIPHTDHNLTNIKIKILIRTITKKKIDSIQSLFIVTDRQHFIASLSVKNTNSILCILIKIHFDNLLHQYLCYLCIYDL